MAEELDVDAVGTMRVLIERKHDDVARFQSTDDAIERAALAHDPEAGAIEAPRHERVEPARLYRASHEMKATVNLGIILDPGDSGDLPIAEVAGQDEDALAFSKGGDESIEVLYPHDGAFSLGRQPSELEKFNRQLREMRIVRLCESIDLDRRNGRGSVYLPRAPPS